VRDQNSLILIPKVFILEENKMSKLQSQSLTLATADADGISLSQTPAAGGAQELTITGALATDDVATMDVARRVLITAVGNETSRTFTVTGTNSFGNVISEEITGPNATTAVSVKDYKTVTSVSVDDDTAGAITVGTTTQASTPWIVLDTSRSVFAVSLAVEVSSGATLNYTVHHCFNSDPNNSGSTTVTSFNHDDGDLVSATANQNSNYIVPVSAIRVHLNSWTSGTVTLKMIQAGKDGV
jgi:hypothetical protein